uniref:FA complementation group F n=1 Tax=Fundulus heteroclitus TaxID=8078 RepID=A0A3Q2QK60_FUNHE
MLNVCLPPSGKTCECGQRHMEAVLRNVASTVELLAVAAHSDVVSEWDEQTAGRAFHWARYCEHIYSRFHSNHVIRGVLEKQLQLTSRGLKEALPEYGAVTLWDLGRCQNLLLLRLLGNPALPVSLLKMLFETRRSAGVTDGDYDDVRGLCGRLVQYKSACKLLRHLPGPPALGADAEVQGEMLMERLESALSRSGDARRAEDLLSSVLQELDGAAPGLCPVIAAALLTTAGSAAQIAAQDFLLDWLQSRHGVLQRVCSGLPSRLLADLAKRHRKFRDAYCRLLKKWASEMEYGISDGEWVHAAADPSVSFQKMTHHFLTLFEACPSLRTETEDELRALKVSDGGFDVRGLSVWGDLLFALSP